MLKLTIMEFFVRAIPEMFTLVFAATMLAREKIDKKKYFITSIVLCLGVFLIRMLPISYGVHTILNIILMTILITVIGEINVVKSIKSSVVITMVMFICECINIAIISLVADINIEKVTGDPRLKTIYGYPSLIFFMLFTAIYYKFIYKKKWVEDV